MGCRSINSSIEVKYLFDLRFYFQKFNFEKFYKWFSLTQFEKQSYT